MSTPVRRMWVVILAVFAAGTAVALAAGQRAGPATAPVEPAAGRLSEWTISVEKGVLRSQVRSTSDRGVDQRVVVDLIMKESRIGKIGDPQVLIVAGATRSRGNTVRNDIPIPEPEKTRALRLTLFERPWESKEPFQVADVRLFEVAEIVGQN